MWNNRRMISLGGASSTATELETSTGGAVVLGFGGFGAGNRLSLGRAPTGAVAQVL